MKLAEISTSDIEFKEAMELYVANFTPDIAHPVSYFEKTIQNKQCRLFIGQEIKEIIVFAITYQLKDSCFFLLDYYAVKEGFRNIGIGTGFLRELFSLLEFNDFNRLLIIEVESLTNEGDKDEQLKRIQFYRRLGFVEIEGIEYLFPHFGVDEYSHMVLMIYPRPQDSVLNQQSIQEMIKELFIEKYNRRKDDPLLQATLNSVPAKLKYI